MPKYFVSLLLGIVLGVAPVRAQARIDLSYLTTRAEASGYEQTTRYDEVEAFLEQVARVSDRVHLTHFGYTKEGRALPLAVFGTVADASPEAVRAQQKTRVFIQANIHGGEVCGKEAMLMLLRALAAGQHAAWADSLVVLVAPLYNADGNERIDLYHRPLQYGPVGGMGQRPNAQGLDLNRDHMKLDSPEARSLVRLFRRYDPHVVIDLHTTNGTRHAYHLTYAPPLHPSTAAPIVRMLREDWLPAVTRAIEEQYGWDFYYYGNVPPPEADAARGWYTFDHRPRFNNNYVGLRGRFAILSEAYAYLTFEDRVLATLYFVEEILDYAHAHAGAIRATVDAVDTQSVVGDTLALRAVHERSDEPVAILMGAVEKEKHPYTGEPILLRRDVARPVQMYAYGTFAPTDEARAPRAYFIPPDLAVAIDRVEAHGIAYEIQDTSRTLQVERFRIDSVQTAREPYQGHRQQTLYGAYEPAEVVLPPGTLVVPVDQPLGRLAFVLLEPRSDDGLASWGLLKGEEAYYPILRRPAEE